MTCFGPGTPRCNILLLFNRESKSKRINQFDKIKANVKIASPTVRPLPVKLLKFF